MPVLSWDWLVAHSMIYASHSNGRILLNVTLDGKTDPFDRVVLTIKLIFIFSLKDYRLCFRFIDPVIFGNLPKEIIT